MGSFSQLFPTDVFADYECKIDEEWEIELSTNSENDEYRDQRTAVYYSPSDNDFCRPHTQS